MLLQRNLVYTAITRGKKLVVIVGTRKALSIAIRTTKTQERYTLLKQRLAQGVAGGDVKGGRRIPSL
jgi:exodeoxyribonuclease V alpha subunit